MWKSTDGGQTWTELPTGLNLEPLAVHPTDRRTRLCPGLPLPLVLRPTGATPGRSRLTTWFLRYWFVYHAAPIPADDWQTVYHRRHG